MSSNDLGNPDALIKFSLKAGSEVTKAFKQQKVIISNRSNIGLLQCSTCQKKFAKQSQYQYHLKTHWDKSHCCQTCGKSFLTKQNLKVHEVVHAEIDERPFSCQYCLKTFQTKQNLVNHENIHLGIKPFQCSSCNKCFREKSTLRKHQSTHAATKKYSCPHCEKQFTQLSSQQRHISKFHDSIPNFSDFLPSLGAEIVAKELMILESS